ncbi:hypothetical protein VNO78_31683 [Psophocarpus tetragonolobus]|uniref:Uncharacterized protein n=1 Tax=Psophocarpus tetragonolobus TaxID=3891 RepID=A0AAN9RYL8_PSOTE
MDSEGPNSDEVVVWNSNSLGLEEVAVQFSMSQAHTLSSGGVEWDQDKHASVQSSHVSCQLTPSLMTSNLAALDNCSHLMPSLVVNTNCAALDADCCGHISPNLVLNYNDATLDREGNVASIAQFIRMILSGEERDASAKIMHSVALNLCKNSIVVADARIPCDLTRNTISEIVKAGSSNVSAFAGTIRMIHPGVHKGCDYPLQFHESMNRDNLEGLPQISFEPECESSPNAENYASQRQNFGSTFAVSTGFKCGVVGNGSCLNT